MSNATDTSNLIPNFMPRIPALVYVNDKHYRLPEICKRSPDRKRSKAESPVCSDNIDAGYKKIALRQIRTKWGGWQQYEKPLVQNPHLDGPPAAPAYGLREDEHCAPQWQVRITLPDE
jgi:hypothetical protein